MVRLFVVTVLVAVGGILFYEGFPNGILLMVLGSVGVTGGITIAGCYGIEPLLK